MCESAETVRDLCNVLATRRWPSQAHPQRIPPWTNGWPLFFQVWSLNAFRSHRHRRLAVLLRHSWLALAGLTRSLQTTSAIFFCGLRRLKRLPSCHSTIKFKWVIPQLEASRWMTNGSSHCFFSWVLTHAFEGRSLIGLCTFLPPLPFFNISGQPTHLFRQLQ